MATSGKRVEIEYLHHELIIEILSWLPVEPLLRFKTVSKLWRDTIQGQNFTHLHMKRCSLIYGPVMWEERDKKPDTGNDTESYTSLITSCHGLMLESCPSSNKYRIRNPLTKNILHLPSPKHLKPAIMCLEFLTKTEEYKIVYFHLDKTTNQSGFELLTIGTDSTWRSLDVPVNLHMAYHAKLRGHFIGDVLYVVGSSLAGDLSLIWLDITTEQFKEVTIPSCLFPNWGNVRVSIWNGKLSLTDVVEEQLHAWILEDYKNGKWCDQKTVVSLKPLFLKDLWGHGNIYVTDSRFIIFLDKEANILQYDLESKKIVRIASAPPGDKQQHMGFRPSMVHFRGMQLQ